MKRKILIALIVVLVALIIGLVVRYKSTDERAMYQGIHARVWAVDFYPNFDPRSTNNIATTAFLVMGSNAVPTLRVMLRAQESWYAKLFVQHGKRLPTKTRSYLAGKIKPGRTMATRLSAVRALGVIGPNATAAVPDLVTALGDANVRWAAAQALASIGGPAISALASATTNKDMNVRHAAVYGLGQAGTNAWPATAALLDRVLDTSEPVRASALYSLRCFGSAGVPVVLEAFSTGNKAREEAAMKAIQAMNTPPQQILRTLLDYTTNGSPELRHHSLKALYTLRLNHPRVVATYLHALSDSNPAVRAAAAQAMNQADRWTTNRSLSEITVRILNLSGTLDSNIVAALNALLEDPDLSVRAAAQQTLANLQSSTAN